LIEARKVPEGANKGPTCAKAGAASKAVHKLEPSAMTVKKARICGRMEALIEQKKEFLREQACAQKSLHSA
jgi:hypothetical protein